MKRQPSEWEKRIANKAIDKELISKIYIKVKSFMTRERQGEHEKKTRQRGAVRITSQKQS